jgi:hypothetical protein
MLAIATGYERLAKRDEEGQAATKKIPLRRASASVGFLNCPSSLRCTGTDGVFEMTRQRYSLSHRRRGGLESTQLHPWGSAMKGQRRDAQRCRLGQSRYSSHREMGREDTRPAGAVDGSVPLNLEPVIEIGAGTRMSAPRPTGRAPPSARRNLVRHARGHRLRSEN